MEGYKDVLFCPRSERMNPIKRYNAIKQLPPEVITACVDVNMIGCLNLALEKIRRYRLTDNWIEWRNSIETEIISAIESWYGLAEYPDHYKKLFVDEWQQSFERPAPGPERNEMDGKMGAGFYWSTGAWYHKPELSREAILGKEPTVVFIDWELVKTVIDYGDGTATLTVRARPISGLPLTRVEELKRRAMAALNTWAQLVDEG